MATELPGFYSYRGRLPHLRVAGATYFVTWRLHSGQVDLDLAERSAVVGAIRHFDHQRYELSGFVVMNDHVHLLLRPLPGFRLEGILHSLKSFTARALQKSTGRVGRVWQHESFDRVIYSEEEYVEKLGYIANNPRKRWPEAGPYPWVWVAGEGRTPLTGVRPSWEVSRAGLCAGRPSDRSNSDLSAIPEEGAGELQESEEVDGLLVVADQQRPALG